jgi:hypothetical protein
LTAGVAATKDSKGNSDSNVSAASESLSVEALARYGGGVTGNASDAIEETGKTFAKIMALIPED